MNAPAFGRTFLISPEASLNDGLLNVNLYPDLSKARIAAYFAEVARAGDTSQPGIERYRARKLK